MLSSLLVSLISVASSASVEFSKSNPIQYVGDNICYMPTKVSNFNETLFQGTWYPYQHQPDFVEGAITSGCKCIRSEVSLSAPSEGALVGTTGTNSLTIANKCNLLSPKGPLLNSQGVLEQYNELSGQNGAFKFTLYGRDEHYQILDVSEDGNYILATVCNNAYGITLRSFCVYYFSRTKPDGSLNLPNDILDRFTAKSIELGIYKPENMRLDYKNAAGCSW